LRTRAIQEPVFSVANTDFEGDDNDNGYGDYIFLVKHGQPSHNGYVTAVAVGQSQPLYSGVGIFNWYYLSSPPQILRCRRARLE
jgi:hypothetical protein